MATYVTEQVAGKHRRSLEVDVFRPAGQTNGVAVVLLHGGGWFRGHRKMVHGYASALASMGYVALAAEYRLVTEAPFPSQIDDIRDVIRWTKANSESLGIDASKVALQGYSAGAHLALLVGGTQTGSGNEGKLGGDSTGADVAAVVSFFAPAKLDRDQTALEHPPLSLLLNSGDLEAAREASPFYYVGRSFPTTFIIGGMADFMQPLDSGLELLQKFVDAGAEVEFHYLHSQTHEFCSTPSVLPDIMAEVAFFYRRTLIEREQLADEAKKLNVFARVSNVQEFAQSMSAD